MSITLKQKNEERLEAQNLLKKQKKLKKRAIVLPRGKSAEFDALAKEIEKRKNKKNETPGK